MKEFEAIWRKRLNTFLKQRKQFLVQNGIQPSRVLAEPFSQVWFTSKENLKLYN